MSHTVRAALLSLSLGLTLGLSPHPAWGQEPFDKAEFAARRARLLERIPDGLAVVLAATEHPYPTRFRQSPDFFYLTGLEEPGAVLVLNGVTKNATVFALKRPQLGFPGYPPQLRDVEGAAAQYGISVQPMEGFFQTLSYIGGNPALKRLYLQLTPPDAQLHARSEASAFAAQAMEHPLYGQPQPYGVAIERLRAALPHLPPADVSPHLDELRWVKTPYEIERLRKSGKIGAAAVAEAMRGTRPGMYEYEIAAAAQFVNTRLGADGDGFPPIVPSGPLTPIVHYHENRRQLQAGEIVYMDYGSDYRYYTSDITRTWPVSGRFTVEQEKMYRCVLEARNAIIAAMKPGVTLDTLQDVAEVIYAKHGYGDAFKAWGRYIGHFIGISVHDVGGAGGPDFRRPLPAGVVFNVEPILALDDRKIHIRLEDTVLLTETGAENLTAEVPAELDQVYALVKERGLTSRK